VSYWRTSTQACRRTRTFFAPTGDMWPAGSVDARVPRFCCAGQHGTPVLRKGKEVRVRASRWLDRFRAVEQMKWCPGMPPTVADRLISDGGWVEAMGVTVFNTYRPARRLLRKFGQRRPLG